MDTEGFKHHMENRDANLSRASQGINTMAAVKISDAWDQLDHEIVLLQETLEQLTMKLSPIIDHNKPVDTLASPVPREGGSTIQIGLWEKSEKIIQLRTHIVQLLDQLDL